MPKIMEDTGLGELLVKIAQKLKPPSHDLPDYERQIRATRLSAGLQVRNRDEIMHFRSLHLARKSQYLQDKPEKARLKWQQRCRRGGSSRQVEKVEVKMSNPPPPAFTEEAFPALQRAA